jgi:hypothetical protein
MRKAIEIFEKEYKDYLRTLEIGNSWYTPRPSVYDWNKIIEEFGNAVVVTDVGSYQGDYLVLYDNEGTYGYAQISYGSCSGCDSLQCCTTWEAVDETIEEEYNRITWFDTKEEAIGFFTSREWELVCTFRGEERQGFVSEAIAYLTAD